MGKNILKNFPLEKREEFIIVYRFLISDAYYKLQLLCSRWDKAIYRLKELYEKKSKVITTEEFLEIKSLLVTPYHELLKIFIDQQSSSYSYKSVRERIIKKKILKLEDFTQEEKVQLNELLQIRNFASHNAQSNINAALESFKRKFPKEMQDYIIPETSAQIIIYDQKSVDINFFIDMMNHYDEKIKLFEYFFKKMQDDFYILKGERVTIKKIDIDIPMSFDSEAVKIVDISMQIQKNKYNK